jgi:glutaredoxin
MFMIISKENCPQCQKAIVMLERAGYEYVEYKIGKTITREEALEMAPGARSVPQIFDGKTHVGGYNELIGYLGADNVN